MTNALCRVHAKTRRPSSCSASTRCTTNALCGVTNALCRVRAEIRRSSSCRAGSRRSLLSSCACTTSCRAWTRRLPWRTATGPTMPPLKTCASFSCSTRSFILLLDCFSWCTCPLTCFFCCFQCNVVFGARHDQFSSSASQAPASLNNHTL